MAGWYEQIPTTLAGVGAGHADVGDPAKIGIIHRPEDAGRHLQNQGTVGKVETS